MKKIKFFMCNLIAIAMLCTILASCSDEYAAQDFASSSVEQPTEKLTPLTDNEHFWDALDSINYVHSKEKYVISKIGSRVNDGGTVSKKEMEVIIPENRIGGKIADQLGGIAGQYGGRWIGGKLFKDPKNQEIGRRVGQIVGQITGHILASTIANIYIPIYGKTEPLPPGFNPVNPGSSIGGTITPGITPSNPTTVEDSIGYIHNKVMNKLTTNKKKYINSNKSINYNLLYTDCIELLKQEDIYNDTISYDLEYRKNVLDFAKETADISISCYNGEISGNTVLEKGITLLKKKYNISDEEAKALRDLSTSITNTASGMNMPQAQSYLNAIYQIVQKEELTPSQKEGISSFANLSISSGLLWDNYE